METETLTHLSDADLLDETRRVAADERQTTARLIAALAEVDARRLYLGEGYASLFVYCTQVLHLSEHAAYTRIEAARASRRFPVVLEMLAEGAVTLTTVRLLAPHLTAENHCAVLASARHRSKREIELLVATLAPKPDVPASVRKSPAQTQVQQPIEPTLVDAVQGTTPPPHKLHAPMAAPAQRSSETTTVAPLSPSRYLIKVTVSAEANVHLRRAQGLLRHVIPNGDPAVIIERGLALLVEHLERTRLADVGRPRSAERVSDPTSRRIPAAVKRAVWRRDGGQCAFVGTRGRCKETGFLEFHHVVPFAADGPTTAENLELRCRAHNIHEARLFFGDDHVAAAMAGRNQS